MCQRLRDRHPRGLDAPVTIATLPVRSAIVPSHWRYDGTSENSEPGPAAMVGYARMVSRSFGGHVRQEPDVLGFHDGGPSPRLAPEPRT